MAKETPSFSPLTSLPALTVSSSASRSRPTMLWRGTISKRCAMLGSLSTSTTSESSLHTGSSSSSEAGRGVVGVGTTVGMREA